MRKHLKNNGIFQNSRRTIRFLEFENKPHNEATKDVPNTTKFTTKIHVYLHLS